MNRVEPFSVRRFWAMVMKEFAQMRRDRVTFGIMIGIPLIQLILFGFAINSDPKRLPAAALVADAGPYARTLVTALENSGYFAFERNVQSEEEARGLLARGKVQFVVSFPPDFSRRVVRGERPDVLIEADATDPAATSNALGTVENVFRNALARDLRTVIDDSSAEPPITLNVHAMYNPERITRYNIVPGLSGVVLTMTMVMITGLAITRERERGTMETLLSMPTRPSEVLLGKIVPYILVGYIQLSLILLAAKFLFGVPNAGSIVLLFLTALLFISANLAMGITISTVAKNQLQAVQMSFFFFLPSLLLSGFMFPFRGMPKWAQGIGEVLPLTHFLRIVRGILLKGNGFLVVADELWPILVFATVALSVGVKRYRQTLE